jgi:hypothetical protein
MPRKSPGYENDTATSSCEISCLHRNTRYTRHILGQCREAAAVPIPVHLYCPRGHGIAENQRKGKYSKVKIGCFLYFSLPITFSPSSLYLSLSLSLPLSISLSLFFYLSLISPHQRSISIFFFPYPCFNKPRG